MGISIVLITGISGHWSPAEAVHTFHADAGVHRDLHLDRGGRTGRGRWWKKWQAPFGKPGFTKWGPENS